MQRKFYKILRSFLLCLAFFVSHFPLFAQQTKIDSLQSILKTNKADTSKLSLQNKLSWEYKNIASYDSAIFYANSALQLSAGMIRETIDPKIKLIAQKGEASSYVNLGVIYSDQSNYPEALKNLEVALKKYESIGDKKGIGSCYTFMGNVYYDQGNFPEELKSFLAALKNYEDIKDKAGIAYAHWGIGIFYFNTHNYSEALKNHLASLKMREQIGDQSGIASSYINIGNVYAEQGNYIEALKNFNAALKIREAIGYKRGAASAYNNIGQVYFLNGNYEEAIKNHLAALKIREAIGDKTGMAMSYTNIGNVFSKQKKYREAEDYLDKANELAKEIGAKDISKEIYGDLTQLDSAKGDFKSAYENHKIFILYRDSIDNEETRKKTIQSQMTFDFEKKEAVANAEHKKELENQESIADEKSRKQKIVIGFVVCGLFLVLVFAGFIFRSLSVTRKQKTVIEEQKYLVESKQKEILDSIHYAKRIQQSLLPTDKYIEKNLNRLKED